MKAVENLVINDIIKRYGWAYRVHGVKVEGDEVKLTLSLVGSAVPKEREVTLKKGTKLLIYELKVKAT